MSQYSKEARKLLHDCIEQIDEQLWRGIKKVRTYQNKDAIRRDLLNQLDVLEKVRKELNKLQVETTDGN